ncbi:hypothetical protein [Chryseobacterium sp. T16E-39]|uniref:hypothetical protein n=1 Tax=Chryseobacterium sp. T16E-39 TaxID=2015076 RepID=UPI0012FC692F|nr:hypothetical protein [Chryseobacterium sp. T16E-39]
MVNWNIISKESRRNILVFITKNHPSVVVESINKIRDIYRIHLLNGKILSFRVDGSFIKNNF